jgi:adhesin transport system outer membrane protein
MNLLLKTIYFVLAFLSLKESYALDTLNIQDAMRLAVTTHPAVLGKNNELLAASYSLEGAKWQRYPALSAQTASPTISRQGVITTMTIDQPLWTGGRISSNINAATARALAVQYDLEDTQQTILIKVTNAFCNMIKFQEKLLSASESVVEHQRLLELIERRAMGEISPENEVTLARARLAQSKSDQLQYELSYKNAKADLEQLTGVKVESLIKPAPTNLMLDKNSTPLLIERAINYSPTLKKLEAQRAAAEADKETKKSILWPQLSARYSHNWEAGGSDTYSVPSDTAFLALTFQPGNGLSSLSTINQAEAMISSAESNRENASKDISDRIRLAINDLSSSGNEVEVFNDLVVSSAEVYESSLRQFTLGKKTWPEVLNAWRENIQAKYSLTDSRWKGFTAGLQVKILMGDITPPKLSEMH